MLATAKGHYNGSQIVLDTPVEFQRGQEVVITYTIIQHLSKEEENFTLVDSLIGAIPDSGKSLEEYRTERLEKYASAD